MIETRKEARRRKEEALDGLAALALWVAENDNLTDEASRYVHRTRKLRAKKYRDAERFLMENQA